MRIFISHSSYDKWVARQISHRLIEKGHATFLDEKDIKTGDSIDTEIQKHLKDSDHLLIIISPSSLKSHWVFIEIGGAKALGKKIVPILLHVETNEIPAPISQLLARDINEFDKYLDELSVVPAEKKVKTDIEIDHAKKIVDGFTIGEKVRIIGADHLTEEDKAQSPKWTVPMDKYSGAIAKIQGFTKFGRAILDVDGGTYRWRTDWILKES